MLIARDQLKRGISALYKQRKGIKSGLKGWQPELIDHVVLYAEKGKLNARGFMLDQAGPLWISGFLPGVTVKRAARRPVLKPVGHAVILRRPHKRGGLYELKSMELCTCAGTLEPIAVPLVKIKQITDTCAGMISLRHCTGIVWQFTRDNDAAVLQIENGTSIIKLIGDADSDLIKADRWHNLLGTQY